jgi:hypothetical protein
VYEEQALAALQNAKGRGKDGLSKQDLEQLSRAVERLEEGVGIKDPTTRPDLLDGRCETRVYLVTSRSARLPTTFGS